MPGPISLGIFPIVQGVDRLHPVISRMRGTFVRCASKPDNGGQGPPSRFHADDGDQGSKLVRLQGALMRVTNFG